MLSNTAQLAVDLNSDVGEYEAGASSVDAALVPIITSANIACGLHAGSPETMRHTVRLAVQHGVAVGAHPSLDDRPHFGRRELPVTASEVTALVRRQVEALAEVAAGLGVRLRHVKPHGALYNMAARDGALAEAVARAVAEIDPSLILVGLSGSASIAAGRRAGLRVANEAFADRGYRPDGSLAPRSEPGAIITDPAVVAARAVSLVRYGVVRAVDGTDVRVLADTICVHGDTPNAPALARVIREALERAGVTVRRLP